LFESRTGLPWSTVASQVERAIAAGHLESEAGLFRPTTRGMHFLNDLLVEFLP